MHYLVEKTESDGRTSSSVRELSASERVKEVARIMGANEDDTRAIEHAKELIEKAR